MNMPSEKYKVVFNQPELSDEEINQYKDFDRILDKLDRREQRKPLHTTINRVNKLVPIIILALMAAMMLFLFLNKKGNTPSKGVPDKTPSQQQVSPIHQGSALD